MQIIIKLDKSRLVKKRAVRLSDIAEFYCDDLEISNRLGEIIVKRIPEPELQTVISCIDICKAISEGISEKGTQSDIEISFYGESDVLVEYVEQKKEKGLKTVLKVTIIAMVTFMGTAFTIMAYHNDIGITGVFDDIYALFGESFEASRGIMEISYSIGLFSGIVLFFNHVFMKRLNSDPTPIEVAMKNYEKDVDDCLIIDANRK